MRTNEIQNKNCYMCMMCYDDTPGLRFGWMYGLNIMHRN